MPVVSFEEATNQTVTFDEAAGAVVPFDGEPQPTQDLPMVPVGEAMLPPSEPVFTQGNPEFITQSEATRRQQETMRRETSPGEGGNPVSRVIGAAVRGGMEAAQPAEPLGLNEDTRDELRNLGIFNAPEDVGRVGVLTTSKDLLEGVTRAGSAGLDFVIRAVDVPIRAGTESIVQVARELGVPESRANRLRDDIDSLLFSAATVTGMAAPATASDVSAATRARTVRNVERAVDDATDGLPEAVRASAREEAAATANSSLDDALRASVDDKIGGPTNLEIAETAYRAEYGGAVRDTVERLRTEAIDGFDPVRRLEEVARERGTLPPDVSPYRDLRLLRGAPGAIEAMQRRGTLTWTEAGDIGFSGEGLVSVFRDVGDNIAETMRYFAGRRAQELAARGIETPFTADEIQWMVGRGRLDPAIEDAFDRYQAFNQRNLEFARQSGLISEETLASLVEAGNNYVPFYRVMDTGAGSGGGNPLARLRGSDRNINDIMSNINRNAIMWTNASLENHAKLQVYDMIDSLGVEGVARRINNVPEEVFAADAEVRAALSELGLSDDGMVQAFIGRRLEHVRVNGNPVDAVYRDGQRVLYEIQDPLLYKAIQHISPQALSPMVRYLSAPAQLLRGGVTLSPDFILRNMMRDTETAFIQSGGTFVPFVDTARGLVTRVRRDDDYWTAMANGAGFGSFYQNEFRLADGAADYYRQFGIDYERQVLNTPQKIGRFFSDAVGGIGRSIEEATSVTEQASRMREFQILRGQGANARAASMAARDVATDFSVRGTSPTMKALTAMVPFMNARIQGLDRMARLGGENPARMFTRSFLSQTVPALAAYQANRDDPNYWALPDWVRDQHFVVPHYNEAGEYEPYLIPKAFEYGTVFASNAERLSRAIETRHGRAFADFWMRSLSQTFAMNPVPQFAQPIQDLATNRNFSGNPIVPEDLRGARPSDQYRPWTSDMIVQLAQDMRDETGVEISPIQVQHLLTGYTGTLGMYGLTAADWLTRSLDETSGSDPSPRLDEMPVLRSFMRQSPLRGTQYESDFYELLSASREQATAFRLYQSGEHPDATFDENERWLVGVNSTLERMSGELSNMRRTMRQVQADQTLSADEKRARMDSIQSAMNELMLGVMRGLPEDELERRGLLSPPPERQN